MKSFSNVYQTFSVIVLNAFIFFILLNVGAIVLLKKTKTSRYNNIIAPETFFKSHPVKYGSYFPELTPEEIPDLFKTPNRVSHPVLEYMERPVKSRFYNVGIENIRYHRYANETNLNTDVINNACWVFGGSTVFGHGVPDDKTIPFYLSELDSNNLYLNFGVQGYHFNLELDKLILLLKKGYKPQHVIFLEGLNDTRIISSGIFHEMETPSVLENGYIIPGNSFNVNVQNIIQNIPIVELYNFYMWSEVNSSEIFDVYEPNSLYHNMPRKHLQLQQNNDINGDILEYYQMNIAFLQRLSQAYGFEFTIFLQPNGILLKDSPYLRDSEEWMIGESFKTHLDFYSLIKKSLSKGDLPLVDLSDMHNSDSYIDLVHYAPAFNRTLALSMLSHLKEEQSF